ncbi:MAG TPA: DUF4279 domain-containing protein [Roseiflexaceae bacterium]|nr:DUF4279 domain-containing protein [Roseiflexaceae bacterium]
MPDAHQRSQPPHDLSEAFDPPRDDRPYEPPYFRFSATLRIFGTVLDLEAIGQRLGLAPTRAHRGGIPPLKDGDEPLDMWSYDTPVGEAEPLAAHISRLWADIRDAAPFLRELKESASVDVFLCYRSNCDRTGFSVPAVSLAMFVELDIPFAVSVIIT